MKELHPFCKAYKGVCSYDSVYPGETMLNVEVCFAEPNNPTLNISLYGLFYVQHQYEVIRGRIYSRFETGS